MLVLQFDPSDTRRLIEALDDLDLAVISNFTYKLDTKTGILEITAGEASDDSPTD